MRWYLAPAQYCIVGGSKRQVLGTLRTAVRNSASRPCPFLNITGAKAIDPANPRKYKRQIAPGEIRTLAFLVRSQAIAAHSVVARTL
jgi:hypothetical protein